MTKFDKEMALHARPPRTACRGFADQRFVIDVRLNSALDKLARTASKSQTRTRVLTRLVLHA